ncbi:hypothetical protein GZ77_09990 [Endozoicomonas montiporae]|uniref:Uncharacterized protein n=3 Tax=Endozoicomonas montiporae TaxID=1027273 RepID=A0A081N864_9GAMM|nr:hypothetical protein [Endozoicomonas montiporae]AMO55476.1 hypothetical protein EZMO1_1284 [Endozoicomonas montiporae CL-33]KEQ14637.1 hypothetical protein GZ77_09990 [Endozoicomonas montiporae]
MGLNNVQYSVSHSESPDGSTTYVINSLNQPLFDSLSVKVSPSKSNAELQLTYSLEKQNSDTFSGHVRVKRDEAAARSESTSGLHSVTPYSGTVYSQTSVTGGSSDGSVHNEWIIKTVIPVVMVGIMIAGVLAIHYNPDMEFITDLNMKFGSFWNCLNFWLG